jgi:serine protease Do
MSTLRKSLAVLVLGGSGVAAWFVGSNLVQDVKFARARDEVQSTREQLATVQDLSSVFRNVGKVVEPSVVNIEVKKSIKTGRGALPFDDDTLKRFFPDRKGDGQPDVPDGFGDGNGDEDNSLEQVGTGSGVIMEVQGGSGFILTNNHVAGGATDLTVTLDDGRVIKGNKVKVLGADAKTDLAVVEIKADHLIPAQWGDSDKLERGEWIMAFGSPFGYVGSMTHGIVSALHRQAGILASQQGYENFIQVDAPINPGNSGGPLTNVRGEVVGINTAIASRSGGFQGIGFAIPSDQAKIIYSGLKEHGKITRGWLGVSISDVSREPALAKSFGYDGNNGVLVEEIIAGTPATGKLQKGDIITELDGKPVADVQELRNTVALTPPDTNLQFTIWRDNKSQQVTIKIGEQPDNLAMAAGGRTDDGAARTPQAEKAAASLGLRLATPSDELAQKYGLTDNARGAVVTDVAPRSPAYKAGLHKGDLITQVGSRSVTSAEEALAAISRQGTNPVRLSVTNAAGSRFVLVEPDQQ